MDNSYHKRPINICNNQHTYFGSTMNDSNYVFDRYTYDPTKFISASHTNFSQIGGELNSIESTLNFDYRLNKLNITDNSIHDDIIHDDMDFGDITIENIYNIINGPDINDDISENDIYDNIINDDIINDDNIYNMFGGAKIGTVFKNSATIYMLADVTDSSLNHNYFNRLDKLGVSKQDQAKIIPHISLMEVYINMSNPDHKILVTSQRSIVPILQQIMMKQYFAINPQIYLVSKRGDYEIMGDFMAKVYRATNSRYITQFRMAFYKYIENILGRGIRRKIIMNNKIFYIYSYRGRDLLAVPDYYHGRGVWKPHLSLIKLNKLQKSNPVLYRSYQKSGLKELVKALNGVRGSINQLNLSYHFNSFRITVA